MGDYGNVPGKKQLEWMKRKAVGIEINGWIRHTVKK